MTEEPTTMTGPRTLYQKHIDSHTVCTLDDEGHVLLYVDRQVANEYTSPQAFSGLRDAGRSVWRPGATLAVVDHVNPTAPDRIATMPDSGGALQVSYFEKNCRDFGIELFDVLDKRQGIEHVVAPEQGFILPGMVVAAGDSHTTTYGPWGPSASVSALPRSNIFWRRRRWSTSGSRPCVSWSPGGWGRALPRRTSSWP